VPASGMFVDNERLCSFVLACIIRWLEYFFLSSSPNCCIDRWDCSRSHLDLRGFLL